MERQAERINEQAQRIINEQAQRITEGLHALNELSGEITEDPDLTIDQKLTLTKRILAIATILNP